MQSEDNVSSLRAWHTVVFITGVHLACHGKFRFLSVGTITTLLGDERGLGEKREGPTPYFLTLSPLVTHRSPFTIVLMTKKLEQATFLD